MDGAGGQASRLPPGPAGGGRGGGAWMGEILSGVHNRGGGGNGDVYGTGPRRKSLSDDLLEMSSGADPSPARPTRLLIPAPAGQQQARQTGRLNLSDGHHSHYLNLHLDLDLDLSLPPPAEGAVPPSPLERFWGEPQRHERIAFMMQQFEARPLQVAAKMAAAAAAAPTVPAPSHPVQGHAPRIKQTVGPEPAESVQGGRKDEKKRPLGVSKPPKPSSTGGFCTGLEIDAELEVDEGEDADEMPDLEAIKIAARIKTEQIFRRGQRECRLGRVRKKIGRAKKSKDEKPG